VIVLSPEQKAQYESIRQTALVDLESIGNGRPELRIYVQHPTPAFQLLFSMVKATDEELEALARQQRQLFEANGWAAQAGSSS
jgi:hypothetical protein